MEKIYGTRIIKRAKGSTDIIKELKFSGELQESFEFECECGTNVIIKEFTGTIFRCPGCKYEGVIPKPILKPQPKKSLKKAKPNKYEK